MTDLEIFERVRAHLLKQNARSVADDGECRYRGDHGRRCAIGCLITDEAYDEAMEGAGVPNVDQGSWVAFGGPESALVARALSASGVPARESTADMLEELQVVHDEAPVHRWAGKLGDMADSFDANGMWKP